MSNVSLAAAHIFAAKVEDGGGQGASVDYIRDSINVIASSKPLLGRIGRERADKAMATLKAELSKRTGV